MFIAPIFIGAPLGILTLLGFAYLLAPWHFSYHRTVMEVLGEETLARKLAELSNTCLFGSAAVITSMMYGRAGDESLRNLIDHGGTVATVLMCIGAIGIATTLRPIVPNNALRTRRRSGLAILGFCALEWLLATSGYRSGLVVSGMVAAAMLAYVTIGTRALGRKAGARTPWPILAALCLSLVTGSVLAIFA